MMHDQASSLRELMKSVNTNLISETAFPTVPEVHLCPSVLAISGGKGGIGKTLTTANLGISLARIGMRVLMLDGDFGLANLDVILNMRPQYTLDDVLNGERHLRDIILTGPEGVRVIPSSSGALKVSELTSLQKLMLLDQVEELDEEFHFMLLDTPAGVSKNVQYWASSSTETILVVTPEPTSLADCYASMKILSQTTIENKFKLIINMCQNDFDGKRVYEKLSTLAEDHLGVRVEYLGSIPMDESVRYSVKERVPFVLKYPFSNASQAMREVARSLATQNDVEKTKGNMQFFWKRLLYAKNLEG